MKNIYKKADKRFVDLFKKEIDKTNKIAITSHVSPDDDSIASVLAVYHYLTKYLKKENTHILYTGEKTEKWSYFTNYDKIEFVNDISDYVNDYKLLIILDGSGWRRVSRNISSISKYKGRTICIDHHPTPDNIFDLHLIEKNYTSTAEIVYDLFFKNEKKLDKFLCETILMGILGDTGNFRFVRSDQSNVFLTAERLVREGDILVEALQSKYALFSRESFEILKEIMNNFDVIKVKGWPDCAYSYIAREYMKKNNYNDNDVSSAFGSFSLYLKSINGLDWGFTLKPRENGTVSFSGTSIPGSVNVRDMVERMKIGGGHDRAAGGLLRIKKVSKAKEKVIEWMRKNEPVIS